MGLKNLASKIAEYNDRLEAGKANKIKAGHVRKVLDKLKAKEESLQSEIADTRNDEKQKRLQRKLGVAREHIARAEYLLNEIA